jgi:hypothetical protein
LGQTEHETEEDEVNEREQAIKLRYWPDGRKGTIFSSLKLINLLLSVGGGKDRALDGEVEIIDDTDEEIVS